MRFMLLQHYAPIEDVQPFTTWTADEIRTHVDAQREIDDELRERGELLAGSSASAAGRSASRSRSAR